jgi:CCT motif/B-box zinc finger
MTSSRRCEMCPSGEPAPAVVFCEADACFLCAPCDDQVHQANRLAQRHVRRPVCAADAQPASEESDILVPDVDAGRTVSRHADEGGECDVAFDDFDDFEGVAFAKMPALNASDSDTGFLSLVPSAGLKAFDSDLSWDAVVPEEFEHVVPDVEYMAVAPSQAPRVPFISVVKSELVAPRVTLTPEAAVPASPVVPVLTGRPPPVGKVPAKARPEAESTAMSHAACPAPSLSSPSSVGALSKAQPAAPPADEDAGRVPPAPSCSGSSDADAMAPPENGDEPELKSVEQRRQIRAEALVRFRAKRANRSFRKKIRYGCRKVLAESRPRVKGRFVKKSDLALYALHGADYGEFKNFGSAGSGGKLTAEQAVSAL